MGKLIGKSDGHEDKIVYDSPLLPKFRSDYCEQARSKMQNYAYTVNSWQVAKPHLYNSEELMSGNLTSWSQPSMAQVEVCFRSQGRFWKECPRSPARRRRIGMVVFLQQCLQQQPCGLGLPT